MNRSTKPWKYGNLLEYLPENYNPAFRYPVVFFLHGSGEKGSDPTVLMRRLPCQLMEKSFNFPYIILAFQLFEARGGFFKAEWEAIRATVEAYRPTSIHATGYSLGAAGIMNFATYAPIGYFASLGIVAGKPPAGYTVEQFMGPRIKVWHSTDDTSPHKWSYMLNFTKALTAAKIPFSLCQWTDKGHAIDDDAYGMEDANNYFKWLASFMVVHDELTREERLEKVINMALDRFEAQQLDLNLDLAMVEGEDYKLSNLIGDFQKALS